MQNIEQTILDAVKKAIATIYNASADNLNIAIQKTRKEFEGDFTIVVFPFLPLSQKNPEQTGGDIGEYLKMEISEVEGYNVVKGFLNLTISKAYWVEYLKKNWNNKDFGITKPKGGTQPVMVEYSCPNTNKPLHLGHIRNNLVGFSIARILEANGNKVIKANLINDRGIHICKSMLAWQKWGNGATPKSTNKKGDHFVGDYYVMFDK
jgi:arginyl-tRNA synthetase